MTDRKAEESATMAKPPKPPKPPKRATADALFHKRAKEHATWQARFHATHDVPRWSEELGTPPQGVATPDDADDEDAR